MNLSKSKYLRGLQCDKSLWLDKNKPQLRNEKDKQSESLFETGNKVGDLAKEFFPNGIEIKFDASSFDGMVNKTNELIGNGTEVIYEAAFKKDGMFVMIDILVRNGSKWDMYEVKGSTSAKEKSGAIKKHYLNDASVQWFVSSNTIELNRAYIMHLNNKYVRNGDLKIKELFTPVDITDLLKSQQDMIKENILHFIEVLNNEMPDIDIGTHCNSPYKCDFTSHCWKHIPKKNPIFSLSYGKKKAWELYKKGILSLDDIPDDIKFTDKRSAFHVKHHKSQEIKIDKLQIKEFLNTIQYPINFFDFETFQNAIPRFDQQRSYAQMPFQYSLHILHEDGRLEHKEFLGNEDKDPRYNLAIQMLKDITDTGSIIAYNKGFEKGKIRDLAELFEEISGNLLALNERFIDLADPFDKKYYYHPKFNGKYSIKIVLPTLFPDDDTLDYKKLGSIQNGGDAMDTFANLHLLKDKSKRDVIRKDLLAYCKLDTFAMVKIWERLHQVVEETNL